MAATTTTASNVPGPSVWELNNRTINSSSGSIIRPLVTPMNVVSFCGVDLVGGDLWNAAGKTPDDCMSQCLPSTGCDGATWTNYNGGTCWFKRTVGSFVNSVPSVGAVSFLRSPVGGTVPGPVFPMREFDMPGNDIGFAGVDSPSECAIVCKMNPFCFAYTWMHSATCCGDCYLKSRASPYVSSPGRFSEYTGRVTNPNTCLHYP